ncbi:MAG: hypothetical protein AAF658_06675 [Myxococcota bacterium]
MAGIYRIDGLIAGAKPLAQDPEPIEYLENTAPSLIPPQVELPLTSGPNAFGTGEFSNASLQLAAPMTLAAASAAARSAGTPTPLSRSIVDALVSHGGLSDALQWVLGNAPLEDHGVWPGWREAFDAHRTGIGRLNRQGRERLTGLVARGIARRLEIPQSSERFGSLYFAVHLEIERLGARRPPIRRAPSPPTGTRRAHANAPNALVDSPLLRSSSFDDLSMGLGRYLSVNSSRLDANPRLAPAFLRTVERTFDRVARLYPNRMSEFARIMGEVVESDRVKVDLVPVNYRGGEYVMVNDGVAAGIMSTGVWKVLGSRQVMDPQTRRRRTLWGDVAVRYRFDNGTTSWTMARIVEALSEQHRVQRRLRLRDPFSLSQVTQGLQRRLDSGASLNSVMNDFDAYLSAFYAHASGATLESESAETYHTRAPQIVSELLPSRIGQRFVDCEIFTAMSHYVLSRLRRRGQPVFDLRAVKTDVHIGAVAIQRGRGARSAFFINNDKVTRLSVRAGQGLEDIAGTLGSELLWGRPTLIGIGVSQADAVRDLQDRNRAPQRGAFIVDREGLVGAVGSLDLRAWNIFSGFAEANSQSFKFEDFVGNWGPVRRLLGR